jgi:hypothetical protein
MVILGRAQPEGCKFAIRGAGGGDGSGRMPAVIVRMVAFVVLRRVLELVGLGVVLALAATAREVTRTRLGMRAAERCRDEDVPEVVKGLGLHARPSLIFWCDKPPGG